jgi:hypothetical protein
MTKQPKPKFPTIADLALLVRALKPMIADDYRSTNADPDDTVPSMDLTIGWSPDSGAWDYQTGDNSFTGGAYGHPIWAIAIIDRRSNSRDIARDLIAQLDEQTWE